MKKFFKNPYIIAWIGVFAVILLLSVLSPLASVLTNISIFLLGGECIYTAVLLVIYQKKKKSVDITEFMNDDEKEIKKANLAQKEAKMNLNIIIFSLFIVGVVLVYLTFRSI